MEVAALHQQNKRVDEKMTDKAVRALNGLEFGDKKLKVQRATVGPKIHIPKPVNNTAPVQSLASITADKNKNTAHLSYFLFSVSTSAVAN